MKHINIRIAFIAFFLSVFNQLAFSQGTGPVPSVAWNKYYWYPRTDNPPVPTGTRTDGGSSGEDWFYNVIKAKDQNGNPLGYLCVGYTTIPAIPTVNDGCLPNTFVGGDADDLDLLSSSPGVIPGTGNGFDWNHGDVVPKISLVDLQGNQIWYKLQGSSYTDGTQNINNSGGGGRFYSAVQTSDGGFIAVGSTGTFQGIKYYNAVGGGPASTLSCNQSGEYPYVVKIDANGNIVWQALYGNVAIPSTNVTRDFRRGSFWGIIPYNGNYIIGGHWADNGFKKAFMTEIHEDGSVIMGNAINLLNGSTPVGENISEIRGMTLDATNNFIYISGDFSLMPLTDISERWDAYVAQINVSNLSPTGKFYSVTNPNPALHFSDMYFHPIVHYNPSTSTSELLVTKLEQNGGFCMRCGENCTGSANGYVDVFDLNLNLLNPSAPSIGSLLANDLQLGITGTSDGGYVIVSTQQEASLDNCAELFCPYSSVAYCNSTPHTYKKDKWNTNAFLSKYDAGHTLEWSRQVKESTDPPTLGNYVHGTSPPATAADYGNVGDPRLEGDIKREECFYNVIEGWDPGSLVICGNNSNNLDDDDLIKLNSDCQSKLLFSFPTTTTILPVTGTFGTVYTQGGNEMVINSGTSTTWNQSGYVYGTVRVMPGATLTIQNCTLQFLSTTKTNDNNNYDAFGVPLSTQTSYNPIFTTIVVQPGGKLILDNATLEGVQSCGDEWDGIEVWGNNQQDQSTSNQGMVSMINGAVIKDAYTGINVQKYDRTLGQWDVDNATGGGIVQVDNTSAPDPSSPTFLNCRFGVRFSTYPGIGQTAQSASFFKYCNFVTDANALNGLNTHATLYDIHGITFTNCTFSTSTQLPTSQPSYGIASLNSEYYVGAYQDLSKACTFSKLHRGQIAWGTSPSKFSGSPLFSIHNENTNFNDCDMPLYYQGTDGCVTNNCSIFWSPTYQLLDNTINHYGIYLDGVGSSTKGDYFCGNNIITSNANGPQFGIIAADHANPSNPANASISGNIITGLDNSIAACGYNGNDNNNPQGLQFLCNKSYGGFIDIAVTSYNYFDGSAPDQGNMRDQGKCNGNVAGPDVTLSDPANNTFNAQTSILLNTDVTSSFKYYYPDPADDQAGFYNPNTISSYPNITLDGASGMGNNIKACPVNMSDIASNSSAYTDLCTPRMEKILITPSLPITNIIGQLEIYDSAKFTLINAINGGNDSLLRGEINGANAGTIGSIISSASGYAAVTDDILITAIQNPYISYATSPLLSLLIKNSSLSDTVVGILKEAAIAFSSGEMTDLLNAQSQVPPSSAIASQISDINTQRDEYLRSVVNQWGQEARDADIETLLRQEGSNESLMMLTDLQLARADTIGADSLLSRLGTTGAFRTGAIQLRQIESSQLAMGMGLNQLDSGQILTVWSIATSGIGAEVLRAKSILQLNRCQVYQEYIPTIDHLKSLKAVKPNSWADMKTTEKQMLSVVPNPSRDITKITTQLIDATGSPELKIMDALGNLILSKPLVQNYDVTSLPVGNLANGVYICAVFQNGKTVMNSKIAVMH